MHFKKGTGWKGEYWRIQKGNRLGGRTEENPKKGTGWVEGLKRIQKRNRLERERKEHTIQ